MGEQAGQGETCTKPTFHVLPVSWIGFAFYPRLDVDRENPPLQPDLSFTRLCVCPFHHAVESVSSRV